tara:strand:- start:1175 stop:1402 length:228 start_codon:yes stop_codon:yes gene_type:complete
VGVNMCSHIKSIKKLLALSLTILLIYPIKRIMESKKLISLLTNLIKDFIKLKAKVSLLETKVNELTKEKKHDRYN